MKKKIYLIDANSFIYRMFFALPEFSRKDGKIVNAVFGMAKFFTGQLIREKPDYIIFIKDAKGKNFRHDLYKDYKATREKMPDNLRSQIDDIEKMVKLMNVEIIAIPGYEADDVIGTLAKKYSGNQNYEVEILSGDKDLYALVSENVKIYDTMKRKKFWIQETQEKFWIKPEHVVDYLAIVWDSADNIPGIAWFWPWKAIPLLNALGDIEKIYEYVGKLEAWLDKDLIFKWIDDQYKKAVYACFNGKTYEKLRDGRSDAFLSKKLATLDQNVELQNFDLETFIFKSDEILSQKVWDFFKEYEFFSLTQEDEKKLHTWKDLWLKVEIISDEKWLNTLEKKIKNYSEIVLDTETTSLNIIEAELVWLSIYLDKKNIYYINRMHNWASIKDSLLTIFLKKIFRMDITIVGHNLKYDLEIIEQFLDSYSDSKKKSWSQMTMSL